MDTENVLDLLGYAHWATEIILDVASYVSPAQFVSSVIPNPGRDSLRGILVHMLLIFEKSMSHKNLEIALFFRLF